MEDFNNEQIKSVLQACFDIMDCLGAITNVNELSSLGLTQIELENALKARETLISKEDLFL